MKIIAFEAENFKRIKAVRIDPTSAVVELTGANRQGKSSILDAIWAAMGGKDHIESKPIRDGQGEAHITLDLGDLTVKRTFKDKGDGEFTTTLLVKKADGSKPTEPQALLNSLVGRLTLDPIAFERAKPTEQFNMLRPFVVGFDFAAHERARKAIYDERTEVNRRADYARKQADGIVLPAGGYSGPSLDELNAQIEEIGQFNASIEKRRANRAAVAREIDDAHKQALKFMEDAAASQAEIARLQALIADHEKIIQSSMDGAAGLRTSAMEKQARLDAAPPLPEPRSMAAIMEQIKTAQEDGKSAALKEQKLQLAKTADEAEAKSKELTEALANHDKAKADAIAAAKLPVDGIDFGDDCVMLRGVPFEQASDAERLEASIAIAAAMNPTLRVIRVSEGSRLDKKAWAAMVAFAEKNDLQIWVESVESGRDSAVLIEDGMVAGAPHTEAAPAKAEPAAKSAAKTKPSAPADPLETFKASMRDAIIEEAIDYAVALLKESKWWIGSTPKEKAYVAALADQARARVGGGDDL